MRLAEAKADERNLGFTMSSASSLDVLVLLPLPHHRCPHRPSQRRYLNHYSDGQNQTPHQLLIQNRPESLRRRSRHPRRRYRDWQVRHRRWKRDLHLVERLPVLPRTVQKNVSLITR